MRMIIVNGLLAVGSFFCLVAAFGMFRFPDAYTRLHAGTKCLTAGATLVLLGVVLQKMDSFFTSRIVLLLVFMFISNPAATHALARACHRRSVVEPTMVIDEYRDFLRRKEGP